MNTNCSDGKDNFDLGYASSSPHTSIEKPHNYESGAHELSSGCVPMVQRAVMTPEMGDSLNLSLQTITVRDPEPGEAVVRILYTGICRSDACFSIGPEPGFPKYNHVAGHEGIGIVVKSFDASLLGSHVAIRYLGTFCSSCTYCLRGIYTSCPRQLNAPKHIAGTFQQYATVPTSCLITLPDAIFDAPDQTVSPASCAIALCSGSTALTALRAARIQAGDVVVVVGIAGAIGHLVGAIAKQVMGAMVVGVDLAWKIDALPEAAHHFGDVFLPTWDGTEETWETFNASVLEACADLRNAQIGLLRGAEAVIVAASMMNAFARLESYVCDGGSIVCVGVPRGQCPVSVPVAALVERNLHVTGNLMGGPEGAHTVMQYIRSGKVKPVFTEVSLEDVPEQMQRLVHCQAIGKVVVRVA